MMNLEQISDRRGGAFAMYCLAKAAADDQPEFAADILASKFGKNSRPAMLAKGAAEFGKLAEFDRNAIISKGAVTAATGLTGNWAEPLSIYFEGIGEFFDMQRHYEIPGQMPLIRRVAFHARLIGAATGATASWVKSGSPAPLSAGVLTGASLNPLKVVATVVVSNETLEFGDPVALDAFVTDLVTASANAVNGAFIDQSNAGVSEEKPASVTNGVTAATATNNPRADVKGILASHPNPHLSYFVGHPALLAGMCSAEFPNVGARGGEIAGVPAIASVAVPDSDLALVDATGVAFARGDVEISTTRQASAQMADNPSGAAAQVSFFQAGLTGIMVSQYVNWTKVRSDAVSIIEDAAYGDAE